MIFPVKAKLNFLCVCVALFIARFCGQCSVDQLCGGWDCQCAASAGDCSQTQQHCTGTHLVSLGQQHRRYIPIHNINSHVAHCLPIIFLLIASCRTRSESKKDFATTR